jgi:hypothetical protein
VNRTRYALLIAPIVLASYFAIRAGLPPAGYCVDTEVVVAEVGDAGEYVAAQRPWRVCNLDGADAALSVTSESICVKPTKDVCLGDWATRDAGPRTQEQKDCLITERAECERQVPSSGGIVWTSAPYAIPAGETRTASPLSRREQMQSSCACRNKVDGGMCRVWNDPRPGGWGPDASVPAPYDLTLQPGRWAGAGCRVTPCVHSEVRERENLMAEDCR